MVDGGWCDGEFTPGGFNLKVTEGVAQGANVRFTIVGMAMEATTGEDEFIIDTVELGRINQCNFLCPRSLKEAAEAWLDRTFNGLLMEFGADNCRNILGEAHMRREDQVHPTKQINAYLKN